MFNTPGGNNMGSYSDPRADKLIDASISGRTRRSYFERRLAAALRAPKLHAHHVAIRPHLAVSVLMGIARIG